MERGAGKKDSRLPTPGSWRWGYKQNQGCWATGRGTLRWSRRWGDQVPKRMLGSPGIGMGIECLSEFWGILGTGDVLTPQKKQGQHSSPHCCTQQPHQHELCPPSCTAGTLVRRLPVFCWFCKECRRVQGSVGSTSVSQSLNSQSFYLEPHLKQRVPVNPRLLSQFSPRANCPPLCLSV